MLKIIVMGTGPFAVPSTKAILESQHAVPLLVTRPAKSDGKRTPPPSPMKLLGEQQNLEIFEPWDINDPDSAEKLKSYQPDLFLVCDYGQILSDEILSIARLGGINLHGSLLPKYRGAAPVQWSVYYGDQFAGVSVIHMTPKLDGGPVIEVNKTKVGEKETAGQLEERLSELGVQSVINSIEKLQNWDGQSTLGEIQNPEEVTKAPRLKKAMGRIDFTKTGREIDCQIRAFDPWPLSFCEIPNAKNQKQRIVIKEIEVVLDLPMELAEGVSQWNPNQIHTSKKEMFVKAADCWIKILRLQPAGKKEMAANEFLRGFRFGEMCVQPA